MKLGYLGPRGTFCEIAAVYYSQNLERIPCQSIDDVISEIDNNSIEIGIVPIENSIEGTVNATMDMLIFDSNIKIIKEIVIPIEQNLLVSKNYKNQRIKKILSHPQALGQCRKFLNKYYNDSELVATSSTSEAARLVSNTNEPWACLSNFLCADLYNLQALYTNIQDNKTNETRFIVISKNSQSQNTNNCKTSIAFGTKNEPGALFKVLNILALWDINMTKIVSRPVKDSIGEYAFFIELEGNITDENILDAMKMVQRKTSFYKIFGSYNVSKKEA